MTDHARLGPSAADRWFACPAAPRMEEGMPDTPSKYAVEGTKAHACLERALRGEVMSPGLCDGDADMAGHLTQCLFMVDAERARYAHVDIFLVEERVYPSRAREDLFGTADIVIAGRLPDGSQAVSVIDLKYGRNRAVPADCKQLAIYALGAANAIGRTDTRHFRSVIMQPRLVTKNASDHKVYDRDFAEMMRFNREMHDAAKRTDDPNAAPVHGPHCGWCKAKAKCPAYQARPQSKRGDAELDIFAA